jgi:hypothetical protein
MPEGVSLSTRGVMRPMFGSCAAARLTSRLTQRVEQMKEKRCMLMRTVVALVALVCVCLTGRVAAAADLAIALVTQDTNGLHYVMVYSKGTAVVHTTPPGQARIDHSENYDSGKARTLWADINRLARDGLAEPTPSGADNINAAKNYIIVLKGEDGNKTDLLFSKCARNRRVDDTMKRLTEGLLPEGSPGIRPGACPSNASAARTGAGAELSRQLPALCAVLQKQGWLPPTGLDGKKREPAEINVPGVLYACRLERDLQGHGPGHAPLLQALIGDAEGASVVFSVHVYCDADRNAALGAMADAIERGLGGIALHTPAPVLNAVRSSRNALGRNDGLAFHTELMSVDAQACSKVRDGELGAVLIEFDAVVASDDAKARD